jgi:hypothetical protein
MAGKNSGYWLGRRFSIDLSPRDYEITVNSTNSRTFKAFIHIAEEGLNPSDVTFIVDPDDACCRLADGSIYPNRYRFPNHRFRRAARAVRAKGEVEVAVRVEADGKVSEVKAISGHPLFAPFRFRLLALRFRNNVRATRPGTNVCLLGQPTDDTKTPRYTNLYRIEVEAPVARLTTNPSRSPTSSSLPTTRHDALRSRRITRLHRGELLYDHF